MQRLCGLVPPSCSLLIAVAVLSSACASGGEIDDSLGGSTFTTAVGDDDEGDTGDGDGDSGDGDGDSGDGDGDSGDGDGDSGDGDGDGDSGDGDGDGDGDSGDGDGDPGLCGNAVIDDGEECDSANNGGQTCITLGFDGGSLACGDDCSFDLSGCTMVDEFCGDGIVNLAEECDGADLGGEDCVSQGFLFGNVTCAANCSVDTAGCSSQTIIDLETGMVPPGFTSGGSANWSVTSSQKWEGTYGAMSGNISHSQVSWAQVTVQFVAPGTVSFYQRISSESGFDYGEFYIDGGLQGDWTGAGAWSQQSYPVGAGQHTLRWTYSKDSSVDSGDDTFYVDYIVLDNGYVP